MYANGESFIPNSIEEMPTFPLSRLRGPSIQTNWRHFACREHLACIIFRVSYMHKITLPHCFESGCQLLYEGAGSGLRNVAVLLYVFCHISTATVLHHQIQAALCL